MCCWCMIRCSGILPDKKGKFQSKWPEYETLWCFGPHSGIADLDAISRYDYMGRGEAEFWVRLAQQAVQQIQCVIVAADG